MRRLTFALAAVLAVGLTWPRRHALVSTLMRLVAATQPNPAKRHGMDMRFPVRGTAWIWPTLKVDLSASLSEVVGYPVEAAAYSHYGGYNVSRKYADFVNPDSNYYQAWIGAYIIFDNERREHFGFDGDGRPVLRDAQDVVEADQRLVYWAAGCPNKFPDGRLVRPRGEWAITEVESRGERWWRLDGEAETWSAYHCGKTREGNWRHYWASGQVPPDSPHPVDDFHPLTYYGSIWLSYRPDWRATCAKFYICPEYTDRNGRTVARDARVEAECQAILDGIAFVKQ
jgi:hypothetical protein